MTIRPILFSTSMIRALMEDRKTQTRRLKTKIEAGDILWARETFRPVISGKIRDGYGEVRYGFGYKAGGEPIWAKHPTIIRNSTTRDSGSMQFEDRPWKPSIHMPKRASRFTQEVTAVRKERLQDISEEDALAEGAMFHNGHGVGHSGYRHDIDHGFVYSTAKQSYAALWESINGKGSWDKNPEIYVITVKTYKQNIYDFLKQREAA